LPTPAGPRTARRRCTTPTRISATAGEAPPKRARPRGPGAQRHHRKPRELRAALQARGYVFASQTDTEVIAHLVDSLYDGDLFEAVQAATPSCTAPTPSP
jgi:hypothetical protein